MIAGVELFSCVCRLYLLLHYSRTPCCYVAVLEKKKKKERKNRIEVVITVSKSRANFWGLNAQLQVISAYAARQRPLHGYIGTGHGTRGCKKSFDTLTTCSLAASSCLHLQ